MLQLLQLLLALGLHDSVLHKRFLFFFHLMQYLTVFGLTLVITRIDVMLEPLYISQEYTLCLFVQEVMISVQTSSVYAKHWTIWLFYREFKKTLLYLHILRQVKSVIYWTAGMSQFWLQMLHFILQCSFDSLELEPISSLYFGLIHHKLRFDFGILGQVLEEF